MDMNLAVLIAMIALMLGGALLLNFQIKHQAKKDRGDQARAARSSAARKPASGQ